MSRTKRSRAGKAQLPARQHNVRDSYTNNFSRLGFGQLNLMEAAEYPVTRMTQNYAMLNAMYRNDWIAGRIIDTIPQDMTKNWYKLVTQLKPDQLELYEKTERLTRVHSSVLEGLKWGRLFGGAAGVIVLDGQEDMLDQPLDLRMIVPGSFKGIIVADRWNGVYPDISLVQDISDPDFGLPEYYNFCMSETDLARGIRVHHSRVLRFMGRTLPYVERMAENYWGLSEIEHVYNELNKRNTTSENIAQLVFQANVRTYKMADLGQLLATMDVNAQRELYQTLTMQNFLMSNMSLNVMDKDDDLVSQSANLGGVSEIYELFMLDIAGACEIPVTKLFGRSPAGMNATGESDLTNYYNKIRLEQEAVLRPIIEKLMPVIAMSTWGMIPDDMDFEFEPVGDSTEEQRASLIQQSADAIVNVFNAGLISQKTALKELRQSGTSLNMWTNIGDEEIENADETTNAPMDEMGMGGGMPLEQSGQSPAPNEQGQPVQPEPEGEDQPEPNGSSGGEAAPDVGRRPGKRKR